MKQLTLNMKPRSGFTLAELLIVIAIIGILAALVLPRLFGPTEQARSSEARNMMGTIRQLEMAHLAGPTGTYLPLDATATDEDWEQLGMENPNNNPNRYFNYTVGFLVSDLCIQAARQGGPENGRVFCLNNHGTWSTLPPPGSYSQTPENPGAAPCPATELCCPC